MSEIIKRPVIKSVDFCVDENIWGHRLYDEQLPHLTVLEFLGVLGSNLDKPLRPHESLGGAVQFRPQRQMRLRGLLFNNPYVESIAESKLPDEEKWRRWIDKFDQGKTGNGDTAGDIAYLRQSFTSFDDFAKAIELLRSSSFESRSNKRWSSKFVFPFGPDALYEDLQIDAKGNMSNDRRFFARTGELLYLMLTRAKKGAALGDLLAERLFDRSASMNRLTRALQGAPQLPDEPRISGYLPEASNPRFDQICEDWLAILTRDIPVYDALEHLIAITGLNMLLYFLERAKSAAGDDEPEEAARRWPVQVEELLGAHLLVADGVKALRDRELPRERAMTCSSRLSVTTWLRSSRSGSVAHASLLTPTVFTARINSPRLERDRTLVPPERIAKPGSSRVST